MASKETETADGRALTGQALVSDQAAERLDPTGFDPSRITEMLQGIDEKILQPIIRDAADRFYDAVLTSAHDYLLENLDYNLTTDVAAWKAENLRFRIENVELSRLLGNASLTHELRLEAIARLERDAIRYRTLIYEVESKFEGEDRYETALRYIREREARDSDASSSEDPKGLSGEAVAARAEASTQGDPA